MASQSTATYWSLSQKVVPGKENLLIPLRPNTEAAYDGDDDVFHIFLYGTRIGTLYSDGAVRVTRSGFTSSTTKNRINDLLIPLGWKVTERVGQWFVVTTEKPYRSMEFRDDMILTSIKKDQH